MEVYRTLLSTGSMWQSRVSRRNFLKGAGAGLATLMVGDSLVRYVSSKAYAAGRWDHEADVVVVGSGGAAFAAAVTARYHGASVIMVEKAPIVGGTTAKSGGGYWIPNNPDMRAAGMKDEREDAIKYMARYSYPHLYHPEAERYGLPEHEYNLIAAFYDSASPAVEFFSQIGALQSVFDPGGPDYLEHVPENKAPYGRSMFPRRPDGSTGNGVELIQQMRTWAASHGITIVTNHRARRLVVNDAGEVIGLEATTRGDETITFRARKGVIFGSGGFTHNKELLLHFQRGPMYGGCAVPTAEGDFYYMAGALGAKMGNMTGAWHGQVVLEQALEFSSVPQCVWTPPGDSMVMVNKFGKRVTNEKRSYNDRTQAHFTYDSVNNNWPNQFLFMVYDERCADVYAGAFPIPSAGTTSPYVISGRTFAELAENIQKRLDQLAPKVGTFKLDESFAANLEETVRRFNEYAEKGVDEEFGRGSYPYDRDWYPRFSMKNPNTTWPESDKPNITMYPLQSAGPYYAIILAAGALDTNGGPVVDENARVLNMDQEPIPGLYGAGNCIASPSATAYWGGGATLGVALTFGYLAGKHAAAEPVRQVEVGSARGA